MTPDRLDELIEGYFEGTLGDAERRELETLLAASPAARRRFVAEARERTHLSLALGRPVPSTPARSPRLRWAAAACLLLGLTLLLVLVNRSRREPRIIAGTLKTMGTRGELVATDRLSFDRELVAAAGTRVRVETGEIAFLAPSLFSISPDRAEADRRVVTLKAGHARLESRGGPGFQVHTPAGTLRDVGTTFEVRLNAPLTEEDLVKLVTAGRFTATVTALVLTGVVEFQSASGRVRRLTPEMGRIPLSTDTAVARVKDREGNAAVKPAMADRWSLAEENLRLVPGDWVRTGTRGANALQILLANGIRVILGPDTQLELTDVEHVRLHRGEAEVSCPEKVSVQVAGPAQKVVKVEGTRVLRARGDDLTDLKDAPRWLTGYKSDASTEALGSLLANVDGRNVPLEIGYHKVIVDIRDQIARTEIEESFVNTTNRTLEGVFYFPLPQDASISGFGMWIGDQYVHADVVEKQRAREIYETILREKRDPGLLEWSGGNVFKASVFPIGAEKRIRISYTQVLPKTGNEYRYDYPLLSEMLRLHPLKKLKIEVKISSTEPVESVTSPSHLCRIEQTEHAGHVEFEAGEYVPDRDFEVRVAVKPTAPAITLLPHRRADDGYFVVLLNAPARDLVTASEPMTFLLMADTSGSMAGAPREAQVRFLDAFLSSLSEKDRFNLMTCDVDARWAFPQAVANVGRNREEALRFLEKRQPLGWSDLDRAFAAAIDQTAAGTQVVYIGDGVVTTGDADPVSFSKRLGRLFEERGRKGTFHAVAPGSTFESLVLKTVAGLGGGSWRAMTDPALTAHQLLREIASPGLKGAKVEFAGFTAAAVYPETLPNLPAGTQQVIVGRYDPRGGKTSGKVIVRGEADGKPVEFAAEVTLPAADAGNSFLPRLWARAYLDHLLQQGSSPEIRDRIIALSEDYQIITPYTSFLVLESDADRERFQVKKRFQIRDGEEFFAKGREDANFELGRKAMLAAAKWRRRLRERVLEALAEMGREWMERMLPYAGDAIVDTTTALGFVGGARDEIHESHLADTPVGKSEEIPDTGTPLVDDESEGEAFLPEQDAFGNIEKEMFVLDGKSTSGGWEYWADGRGERGRYFIPRRHDSSLRDLFPRVAEPRPRRIDPAWPKDILDLLASLDRRAVVAKTQDGYRIMVSFEHRDERRGVTSRRSTESLLGPSSWLVAETPNPGHDFSVEWCFGEERGILRAAWLLGSTRKKKAGDESSWNGPWGWYFGDWVSSYASYIPSLRKLEDGRVELTLVHPSDPKTSTVLMIDPARFAIVEVRNTTHTTLFEDFVEAGGAWWPRKMSIRSILVPEDSVTYTFAVSTLDEAGLRGEIEKRLAIRSEAIVIGPLPRLLDPAKQAIKDGKARLEDLWAVLLDHASRQNWDRVEPIWNALSKQVAGKRGQSALHLTLLSESRRLEELKTLLGVVAVELVAKERSADYACALSLLQHAGRLNQGSERLTLVQALRPVFERYKQLLEWDRHHLGCLQQMARWDEAFRKQKEMAEKYPIDAGSQTAYAVALAQRGEVDAALAHLAMREKSNGPWKDHEVQSLRTAAGEILLGTYRLVDFLAHADAWVREAPKSLSSDVFNRYLSTLVMLDRETQAWTLTEKWLKAPEGVRLEGIDLQRFEAAFSHAQGEGHGLYVQRFDPDRVKALVETARRLLLHETLHGYAQRIFQNWRFVNSDESRGFLKELYAKLTKDAATLPPLHFRIFFQATYGRVAPEEGDSAWQKILDIAWSRWESAAPGSGRAILESLLSTYARPELRLKLFRKNGAARPLFDLLVGGKWSAEAEREAAALIPTLLKTEDPDGPEAQRAPLAFHRFATWITTARAEAKVQALPGFNELPRRQLKTARADALKEARAAAVTLLAELEKSDALKELHPWIAVEKFYHQAKLKQDAAPIRARATTILRDLMKANEKVADEDLPTRDRVLALRLAATLLHLSAQGEPAEETLRLLRDARGALLDGRDHVYRLFVALDRGDEVEALLKSWVGDGATFEAVRWARDYAYVLAERNQIDDAIKMMDLVEKAGEIQFQDARALADWHMARADAAAYREARIRSWATLSESSISNLLHREYRRYQRTGAEVPSEIDEELPLKLIALFRKSEVPQSHVWMLRQLYEATRDFRILECVADAVLGHSSQQVYPLLGEFRGLADSLQEEATLDRLATRIAALQEKATIDPDRRALRLLEFMMRRRAAEMSHGTAPHMEAALRALREAFRTAWSDGERELMAGFLADMGRIEDASLAGEQLVQLETLHRDTAAGSWERLVVASHLARLHAEYSRAEEAARTLKAALDGFRTSSGGLLPASADGPLQQLSGYFVTARAWASAEGLWLDELTTAHPVTRLRSFKQHLFALYLNALRSSAEVSLGRGDVLYAALRKALLAELEERSNEDHMLQLTYLMCALFDTQRSSAKKDLADFAFQAVPRLLATYQYRRGQEAVSTVADTLHRVNGAKASLEFLVARAETEPRWIRLQGADFWPRHAYALGKALAEAGAIEGGLEERALAIVLRELREDLRTGYGTARVIYWNHHDAAGYFFWSAKASDFLRVALEVLAERRKSEAGVMYVADYLYQGLGRHGEAIDALLDALKSGILGVDSRIRLCQYLQMRNRHGESIPILTELIELRRDHPGLRVMLMKAYAAARNLGKLSETYEAAAKHFKSAGMWSEGVISTLADACIETGLHEAGVGLYREAITLHTRGAVDRGIADGTLAFYYRRLSVGLSKLGRTDEAVDAAAGAIVAWGPDRNSRAAALSQLEGVLREARDLDASAARIDAEARKSGVENPILRKALGRVYAKRDRLEQAAAQFRAAIEARPEDLETQRELVEVYDRMGKADLATEQLLAASRVSGHDLSVYRDLGLRWKKLEKPDEAERAWSSTVEMMPHESESHQAYAGILESELRWGEAEAQWRQVVRIRSKEPAGYLGLADVLIRLEKWREAREVVNQILRAEWPSRFGDVRAEALKRERLIGDRK